MRKQLGLPRALAAAALGLTLFATSSALAQPEVAPRASPGPGEPTPAASPLPPLGLLPTGLVPPSTVVALPALTMTPSGPEAAPAPSGPMSSWEIELDGYLGSTSISAGSSYVGMSESETHGSGELFLTGFLAPVVDDDAPHTLQPFLQRESTITADGSAGGFRTTVTREVGSRVDWHLGAGLAGDVYVTRYLALTGAFSYLHDELQDSVNATVAKFATGVATDDFSPGGGVGVRLGDARFDLSYTALIQTPSSPVTGNWGTLALSAHAVVARRVDLQLTLSAFHGGAGASGSAEYFFTKDVGVFVGGLGDAGASYNDGSRHDDYGFNVGVGVWPVPRLRLVAAYDLTGNTDHLAGAVSAEDLHGLDNTARLTAMVRLP